MSLIYTFIEAGSLAVGVTRSIKNGDQVQLWDDRDPVES
jgi:hypothetical protein